MGSNEALGIAVQAELWGQRPSGLLMIRNPLVALEVDDALAQRLLLLREAAARKGRKGQDDTPPAGLVYEDLGDLARQVAERERGLVH